MFYPRCRVQVGEFVMLANLIVLAVHNFDVILGMDWLAKYRACIGCFHKIVTLEIDESSTCVIFEGSKKRLDAMLASALKAERQVHSGHEGFIAFIIEDKQSKKSKDISVARKFPDVFLDEVSGLPPIREIGFTI